MASRSTIFRLINASQHSASCPCHGGKPHVHLPQQVAAVGQLRKLATPVQNVEKEYAFEVRRDVYLYARMIYLGLFVQVAASNLRFGDGVTAEVGMDLKNLKATKVRAETVSEEGD